MVGMLNRFQLQTIKYKSADEISLVLEQMAQELYQNTHWVTDVCSYLEEHAFPCRHKDELLLFAVLASFVLGDMAYIKSPELREENIKKMQSMCEKKGIPYDFVRKLTAHETALAELAERPSEG